MVSLTIDPPPSFRRARSRRGPLRVAAALLALAAAVGAGFWLGRNVRVERGPPAAAIAPASPSPAPSAVRASPAPTPAGQGAIAAPASPAPAMPTPAADPAGPRVLRAIVSGALEDSISSSLGKGQRALAEELTAVVNRLLVWELNVARDGRRGDRLELLWTPAAEGAQPGEPVVEALRYASQKLGRTVAAYRFRPEGARWPRYYRADGSELEQRIADAPMADYEQITSLLRDGRRHKGIDFKTPVGSPVHAPFDGVVERRNWNFAGNGNCLDVLDPASGRHAIFLHLDVLPKEMRPGRKVAKGEVIAASGNSGRSFAPHLHYQLESPDGRVLDPFEVHRTERLALSGAQKTAFDAARARLDSAIGG